VTKGRQVPCVTFRRCPLYYIAFSVLILSSYLLYMRHTSCGNYNYIWYSRTPIKRPPKGQPKSGLLMGRPLNRTCLRNLSDCVFVIHYIYYMTFVWVIGFFILFASLMPY